MKIFDILTGEEYEISDEAIDTMDRAQEEYQSKLDQDLQEERLKKIYDRSDLN